MICRSDNRLSRGGSPNMQETITIKKSPTADTRTCDFANVTEETLYDASLEHIQDVQNGLKLVTDYITLSGEQHDWDKLKHIDELHTDFVTGFQQTGWWDNHRKISRHHLAHDDGVPADVNLMDVLEYITDCVMAGMARSGKVYEVKINPGV